MYFYAKLKKQVMSNFTSIYTLVRDFAMEDVCEVGFGQRFEL